MRSYSLREKESVSTVNIVDVPAATTQDPRPRAEFPSGVVGAAVVAAEVAGFTVFSSAGASA